MAQQPAPFQFTPGRDQVGPGDRGQRVPGREDALGGPDDDAPLIALDQVDVAEGSPTRSILIFMVGCACRMIVSSA